MHGVNLDQLGRRDPAVYGTLTLAELECAIAARAGELGLRVSFFQSNHEGAFVERLHALREGADGDHPEPGRVDALRVVDARRARDRGAAGGRGSPLRRERARAVAARVGDRRALHRDGVRARRRRVLRGARRCCARSSRRDERPARASCPHRPPGRGVAPARAGRAARRRAGEPALPDGLRRQQRPGAVVGAGVADGALSLLHRLPLHDAVGRPGPARVRTRDRRGSLLEAAARSLGPSGRLGFDDTSTTVAERARLEAALPQGWRAGGGGGRGRAAARGQGRARDRAHPRRGAACRRGVCGACSKRA